MTVGSNEVPCVGAVVHDLEHRLLLIRRGHEPGLGLWSLPGGRVEAGETGHQAVVREVEEETGLTVHPTRLLGTVRRDAPDGRVYVIADYLCEVSGAPEPHAATDAADARWVDAGDYRRLPLIPGLTEALDSWDALPR